MSSSTAAEILGEWEKIGLSLERMGKVLRKNPSPQVGVTPKEVIWSRNKSTLYHYLPVTERRHRVPILLVYALINRPYVMDLYPGRSMVEALLQQGFEVYLLDWGTFGPEDKNLKFDDFVMDYMPAAVRKVLRHAEADEVSILGYCMGGTISILYAALHPDGPLRNLALVAAPVDFHEAGLFSVWLSPRHMDVDRMVDTWGNIPPEAIDFGNKLLKPVTNWVRPYVGLSERGWDDNFLRHWMAVNKWVNDNTPFPGEAFRQWIKEFYQENKLVKGELMIRNRKVDLKQVRANLLNVVATTDHIVQPCQATITPELVGSEDKETFSVRAGHVAVMIGSQGPKIFYPKLIEWLGKRSS